MSKKCVSFFGGLLNTQEKWLNKCLKRVIDLFGQENCYTNLKKCKPDEVTYCVEFIGENQKRVQ